MKLDPSWDELCENEFPILRGRLLKMENLFLMTNHVEFPILRGRLLKVIVYDQFFDPR